MSKSPDNVDVDRRHFLTTSSKVLIGIGAGAAGLTAIAVLNMRPAVKLDFEECVAVFRTAIVGALTRKQDAIRELHRTSPLQALAFDLLPWDPYAGLAFRLRTESGQFDSPTNSADWKNSHFDNSHSGSKDLSAAAQFAEKIYDVGDPQIARERAHILFVAAAHAALDKSVAEILRQCGVDADVIDDSFEYHGFDYFVMDSDATLKFNYCDLILANRVTQKMLGKIV